MTKQKPAFQSPNHKTKSPQARSSSNQPLIKSKPPSSPIHKSLHLQAKHPSTLSPDPIIHSNNKIMKSLNSNMAKDEPLLTYIQTLSKIHKTLSKSLSRLNQSQKDLNFQINLEPSCTDSVKSIISAHSSDLDSIFSKFSCKLSILDDLIKSINYPIMQVDSRRSSCETNSIFNTLSIDNLEKIEIIQQDLAFNEEINEIAKKLNENHIIFNYKSPFEAVSKAVDLLIKLRTLLTDEDLVLKDQKDLSENVSVIFSKCKTKIMGLEHELNLKARQIFELSKIERLEISQVSRVNKESNSNDSKLLNLAKFKLSQKKKKIKMHKEQIVVLKNNVRELQDLLKKVLEVDVFHIRELWWSIGKEIPVLDKDVEESIQVFTRMLGFSRKDVLIMNDERKDKKIKRRFTFF